MIDIINKIRILLTRQDKFKLVWVIILMVMGALIEIAGIGLIMPVVAVFTKPELLEQNVYLRHFYHLYPWASENSFMLFSCLCVGGIYVFKNLFSFWVIQIQTRFVYGKYKELSVRLFRTYLDAPYMYHLEHSAAKLNSNVLRIGLVCNGILLPAMMIVTDFLVVIALMSVLVFFMPLITLGSALFICVSGLVFYFPLRNLNARWGKKQARADIEASRIRLGGLNGIKDIKSANAGHFFIDQYDEAVSDYTKHEGRLFVLGQVPRLSLESTAIMLALGIFIIMIWLKNPAGTILLACTLLIATMSRMLPAFSRMYYNLARARQVMFAFDSLFYDITRLKAEELGGGEPLSLGKKIEICDITFGYTEDKKIFDHFSLVIEARQSVALVGATGSGKTTLVDLLLGLLKPREGAILADGRNIESNLGSWRSQVAYVPQFIFLVDGTIRANVAFGVPPGEIDEDRVRNALKTAQLLDFVDAHSQGLDLPVGANGVNLSGGQRQRLGIARALYNSPGLLILDEATSALDNDTEKAFVEALKMLKGKLTIIMIAHRLSTIENCDRTVRL